MWLRRVGCGRRATQAQRTAFPLPSLVRCRLRHSIAANNFVAELLALAAGSPGALLSHRERWNALPDGFKSRLQVVPSEPMDALALARDLCESLDVEQQLWLIDWWQQQIWRQSLSDSPLKRLETLRRHLLSFVQPRLAWEVTLLDLITPRE